MLVISKIMNYHCRQLQKLQTFEKIGFWDCSVVPVVSNTEYLEGFFERIKEWQIPLSKFKSSFSQQLENGYIESYMGYSHCRVCNFNKNGYNEINYIKYTFPVGYLHYILEHHIEVPVDFQKFVLEVDVPKIVDKTAEEIDLETKCRIFKMMVGMSSLTFKPN